MPRKVLFTVCVRLTTFSLR